MKTKNFTTTITVSQSPKAVFDAINNVRGWWSGEILGRTDKLGEEFTYRYEDLHRTTQKITEFIPGKKVVWHVLKSRISFVKDMAEWNGTEIVFEITQKITEIIPGKKVVWHVLKSRISFVKDMAEWNGTEIVFEITKKSKKTQLRFTHTGLVRSIECYGDCSGAWSYIIKNSLRSLITKGKGQPIGKE